MSRTRDIYCPRCDHNFPVAKDEGDTAACPQCCCEFDVEWSADEDGESVRGVVRPMFIQPPTGTIEASVAAIEHVMFGQMGIPANLLTEEQSVRYLQQTTISESLLRMNVLEECDGPRPSINVQAEMMGMRVFNNRKRMRKRVRQRRRHWSPYDDHWSQHPGDW